MVSVEQLIKSIHQELGIAADYPAACGMALQQDCTTLVNTELDVFGRQPQLDTQAYAVWCKMKNAAEQEGVKLQIISGYRSIEYQKQLFVHKLARAESINAILKVNAAPGYSEHHSGRAVDVGCPDYPYLEVAFEDSPAFAWLSKHAGKYRFFMSFPKDNAFGVQYEPWHWCYRP
jgi:D-alanyl-D-alanine carboxypeptidase